MDTYVPKNGRPRKIRIAFSRRRFAAEARSILGLSLPANKAKIIAIRYACARKLLLTDERMCVSGG